MTAVPTLVDTLHSIAVAPLALHQHPALPLPGLEDAYTPDDWKAEALAQRQVNVGQTAELVALKQEMHEALEVIRALRDENGALRTDLKQATAAKLTAQNLVHHLRSQMHTIAETADTTYHNAR